jgi:hypothetical protein
MPPPPPPLNLGRFTASTCGGSPPPGEASVRIAAPRPALSFPIRFEKVGVAPSFVFCRGKFNDWQFL